MPISQTDIANQALARIGAPPIMDLLDESSKGATLVRSAYNIVVEEVARAAEWNCLKRRANLAQNTTGPEFGWTYSYPLPAGCLRVVKLNGLEGHPDDDFEVEGRDLLTDADTAKIEYIFSETDTNKWDALFTNAVVVLLAARIATAFRQDEGVTQGLISEYERVALPRARQRDFGERRKPHRDPGLDSRWINSRFSSTNG